MKTLVIRDEFDCSVDDFWEKFMLDEAFFERLNPHIEMKERQVLAREENGNELYRKIKNTPSREVPGFIKKIVGNDMSYIEESWFDRSTKAYRYQISSPVAGKRLDFQGTVSVTPLGENKCVREMKSTINVTIMLVGGKIEAHLAKQIEEGYEATTRFIKEEIRKTNS